MIFVTGGTGLVGTHLLFDLISAGKKVRALKRPTSNLHRVLKTFSYYTDYSQELFDQIEWVDGDIMDYYSLENVLTGVTEVYHCAAIISFETKERNRMISNNKEGTANLVNAAIESGVTKICHVSSISALGKLENEELITEETKWIPSKKVSGYSESKYYSETEIWRGMEEGLNAVIVNPSIIFGPADWETGSAKMFKTIWDGMRYYTKGTMGFVDVKDVSRAMIQLMEDRNFKKCKNQRYVINSENLSYQNVFNQIADELKKPRPTIFASNFLLGVVWRVATLLSWITGKPALITRDSASNSNETIKYDGKKIERLIGFEYLPISQSIKQTAGIFKSEMTQ
jgi:nucleoside-diphosphate-sugar epimerase